MMPSAVVLTQNSADCLEDCLRSLKRLTDDIVIVDGQSTDGTLAICKRYGCRTFQYKFDIATGFAGMRNFGDSKCRRAWILHLDSDEILSDELVREIKALREEPEEDAFRIRRNEYFLNRRFLTTRIVRLFRKSKTAWVRIAHEDVEVKGGIGKLWGVIEHTNQQQDLDTLIRKLLRVTKEEYASVRAARGEMSRPAILFRMAFEPLKWFLGLLFYKGLILRGFPGLIWAVHSAHYEFLVYARMYEETYVKRARARGRP